jgi:glucose/arabinose dehydrogenase
VSIIKSCPRASSFLFATSTVVVAAAVAMAAPPASKQPAAPTGGGSPFSDYRTQTPGASHHIRASDLPAPGASESVDNGPKLIKRPKDAWPQAPKGFKVELYAEGNMNKPRLIRTAPNGDFFVADSDDDLVRVFRGIGADGKAKQAGVFARGLRKPFGIAFYPPTGEATHVYVANTDGVVRFPYKSGDLEARAKAEDIAKVAGGGRLRGGGHWTRDVAFSRDGKKMYVSVGSQSNNDDPDENSVEKRRALIHEMNPDGSGERIYAHGIRNPVGIAVHPRTGELWTSVNERDGLGDNLVPDYITRVKDGGFYGWPYYYIGPNHDPRHKGKKPELRDKVIVPDVLLMPHNASLQLMFYEGKQFPAAYRGDVFAAQHGSWNRALRTGYNVVRVPLHGKDKPTGEYEEFLTGFVTAQGEVWGRPVGVTTALDGSLLVTDDGSKSIWRVSYTGK